ncbi:DUF1987 domain-containing protein [Williamwhitmania taraxaci]|uniref:SiaC family regulatory phosphoprotein domain-containing protein n=1 Tax=Williamwhitmania taraxaci TaxID=1640674 RepID=A0A1G6KK73_9BACT|nr:DUF1987 domain-containing protein [Williamwhitmania taraxaci]SDC31363.1 protein of unknown function [Williamwhitmania taraxaci]
MKPILIDPTEETPKVVLDQGTGVFEIIGNSLPEDVLEFYNPIITWLSEYTTNPNPKTSLIFNLEYYNTSSSKMFIRIFEKMRDLHRHGHIVEIQWHFFEDDDDMLEAGEDYADNLKLPFTLIKHQRDT